MRVYSMRVKIEASDEITEEGLRDWVQSALGPAARVDGLTLVGKLTKKADGPLETCEGCGKDCVLASHLRHGAALPVRLCSVCHDAAHVLHRALAGT